MAKPEMIRLYRLETRPIVGERSTVIKLTVHCDVFSNKKNRFAENSRNE